MVGKVLRALFLVVLAGYGFILLSSHFSYIEPYLFPLRMIQGEARYLTENIIIGPYPHREDLEKLKEVNGVTVVISLLNPSMPFEESLIEMEKSTARDLSLTFYNVPISYLNLNSPENNRSVLRIKEILKRHRGEKVYIHCYLGRHRVDFVGSRILGALE